MKIVELLVIAGEYHIEFITGSIGDVRDSIQDSSVGSDVMQGD